MSAAARPRVARVYTGARRHPWVLGKLGDWMVPFGPYTPAQLVVLGGGAFALVKGYDWWSWAGPVPVVLWLVAVWAVRGAQIAGQNPFTAVAGVVVLLLRHPAGRIGGRIARERRSCSLRGRFVIQTASGSVLPAAPSDAARRVSGSAGAGGAVVRLPAVSGRAAAGSGLDSLLAGSGRRAA
ncbi:hypothetical protein GCM10010260_82020 [Streptomyces filipinensis]|uniref:Uncharacterized protein n=1 Tax=Streptomyces filipinensis TaxID=66887 RepID=A0A918IKI9_9ACTN|nr:hypothetical protein [Streptomyces filipinensis]GGV29115.1 hypothetical protein GCM10010260_82020 [Streptomyces filipinensis]